MGRVTLWYSLQRERTWPPVNAPKERWSWQLQALAHRVRTASGTLQPQGGVQIFPPSGRRILRWSRVGLTKEQGAKWWPTGQTGPKGLARHMGEMVSRSFLFWPFSLDWTVWVLRTGSPRQEPEPSGDPERTPHSRKNPRDPSLVFAEG